MRGPAVGRRNRLFARTPPASSGTITPPGDRAISAVRHGEKGNDTVKVIETTREHAERIDRFRSHGAWSNALGGGTGACHVYVIHFDAPGEIGPHEAGFDQLFVVVAGTGWGAGADGVRVPLRAGQAAVFRRGELHSKGSDAGMTAIMIQVDSLTDG
jgi:quercetin dioxygenase-like cupin family protein